MTRPLQRNCKSSFSQKLQILTFLKRMRPFHRNCKSSLFRKGPVLFTEPTNSHFSEKDACTHIQKAFYNLPTTDVVRFDLGHLLFELESGNENVDGQTDVGHMNLIGGLVTHKDSQSQK